MQNKKNALGERESERQSEWNMLNCYKRSCEDLNVIRSNAGDEEC